MALWKVRAPPISLNTQESQIEFWVRITVQDSFYKVEKVIETWRNRLKRRRDVKQKKADGPIIVAFITRTNMNR